MGQLSQTLFTIGSQRRPATERGPGAPRPIAAGDGVTFWRIGTEVYRAATGAELDTAGQPMGKRWECTVSHWLQFRDAFAWAQDVPA